MMKSKGPTRFSAKRLNHVSFRYGEGKQDSLSDVSFHVEKGSCILLCGGSGCGKTTVTRLINGLIPHFFEGQLDGSVTVCGKDIAYMELYELAPLVGTVFQNPRSQFLMWILHRNWHLPAKIWVCQRKKFSKG